MILENFAERHPLLFAIIIDILMLIPVVDFFITVPLQYILWKSLKRDKTMAINIIYDLFGDFVIPVVGDIFPLNTLSVLLLTRRGR